MYIIYKIKNNEKFFLKTNGCFEFTNLLEDATKWNKKQKADNVLNNIPSKIKGEGLKVELLSEEQISKENTKIEISFLEKINEMFEFIKNLEDRKEALKKEISHVDLEITDIEHYAEFNKLNAVDGYKVYKMLHDARIKRRKLKPELKPEKRLEEMKFLKTSILKLSQTQQLRLLAFQEAENQQFSI